MRHIVHDPAYDTAILIKETGLKESELQEKLINPSGLKCVSFSLDYAGSKKSSAATRKAYLATLLPALDSIGITDILVCDGDYFKTLTGVKKVDPHYGYVLPCSIKGYEHLNLVLCPQPAALMFNPTMSQKIDLALNTMVSHKQGNYSVLGEGIIHSSKYLKDYFEIAQELQRLHQYPVLTADIEAFSLKHYSSGIGSIAFAWDQHNGVAMGVDYKAEEPYSIEVWDTKDKCFKTKTAYGSHNHNAPVRALLKKFFEEYQGKLIWHNASFDCTILVYQLWMNGLVDQKGLLEGLEVMTRNIDDTKIITYLATNSCAGNNLKLKDQAHEFAGNYAESEINNIKLIEESQLLRYNLVDCLSTWYVFNKHYKTMVEDDQLNIYNEIFMPSIKTIVQMQLTGMCLDMNKVLEAETYLSGIHQGHISSMENNPIVKDFTQHIRQAKVDADNLTLKTKTRTMEEVEYLTFNPNSGTQLQELLYSIIGLPVIDLTDSKQPATGGKTLKKLLNHTDSLKVSKAYRDNVILLLEDLKGYIAVDKVLTAFIPRFKEAPLAEDGMHYLFGNFNLGGTVSGRLSSSGPK